MPKAQQLSRDEYRRNYLHAMEAPEVFRSVTPVDIYEGFSRHRELCNTFTVDGKLYTDMVRVKDIGLFQRLGMQKLVQAYGIKDATGITQYLSEEGKETPASILLADFLQYVVHARDTLNRTFPHQNGQFTTYPFLTLKGIVMPEHFRKQGQVPVRVLGKYFEAVEEDVRASGALPRQKKAGIVNDRYRAFASVEELAPAGDTYVPTKEALRVLQPYFSAKDLQQFRKQNQVEWKRQGTAVVYKLADLQQVISKARVAAVNDIGQRSLEQEVACIIPQRNLRIWLTKGGVSYTTFLMQKQVSKMPLRQVEELMDKLERLGIKVKEPSIESLFNLVNKTPPDIHDEKENAKAALQSNFYYLFNQLRYCRELEPEAATEIGRAMVASRKEFVSAVVRNPEAAVNIAETIEEMLEGAGWSIRSLFSGEREERARKRDRWHNAKEQIASLARRAEKAEKSLERSKGDERENALKEYQSLQAQIPQIFHQYGFNEWTLARITARFMDVPHTIPEADSREEARAYYTAFMAARNQLASSIAKLAVFWAKKYAHGRKFEQDFFDAYGAANIGLMEGIDRWNPSRSIRLSTYISHWIRQGIQRSHSYQLGMREPQNVRQVIADYRRARAVLFNTNFREPTLDELAERMKIPREKAAEIKRWANNRVTLESTMVSDEESNMYEFLVDKTPEQDPTKKVNMQGLRKVLERIVSPRLVEILIKRAEGMTLAEVGVLKERTRERIRQYQKKALEILQQDHNRAKLQKFVDDII